MEGNFFRIDAQRAHGDGFVLTQKPTEQNSNQSGCFDCNICLDIAHDPVVTLCGHLFCWPCIDRWLDVQKSSSFSIIQHQNCPVCKSNISIASLVPLYGRGMSSSSSSSETMIIPQRPASYSLNPSLQHQHQAQTTRGFTATESSTDLANAVMMSFLYPVIEMFGDMVYARIFGTFTNTLSHPYQNVRPISGNNNSQRNVQLGKALHRVSIFFLCCIILCLLLF